MKDLVNKILERKNDKTCELPHWADFMCIDLNQDNIEYYTVDELHDHKSGLGGSIQEDRIEKLKVGESYFDEKDNAIYVMLIDQSALNEK